MNNRVMQKSGFLKQSFALTCMLALFSGTALAQTANPAVEHFRKDVQPLLKQYCYDCHGDGSKEGNIAFDQLNTDDALLNPDLWFKAIKNVRAGLMPAGDSPKPKAEERAVLENWIKRDVFKIDPVNPDPGRVTLRRLNRTEYKNTIRDLMGYDFKVEEEFPPDDTGYGFDTIGDVLSISPMLLEKYMQAAEVIVPASVGTINKVIPEYTIPGARFLGANGGNNADRVSFFKGGTFTQPVNIQREGEYRVIVQVSIHGSFDFDPGKARMTFAADQDELFKEDYIWQDGKKYSYEAVRKLTAGEHQLALNLAEIKPESATGEPGANLPPPDPNQVAAQANSTAPGRRTNIDLRVISVRVEGPLDKTYWKAPPNYTRFFPSAEPPADEQARKEYAREVLSRFGAKAFRRPVDSRTLDKLVAIAQSVYTQPDKQFEQGIQQAMIAMLASPRFIFRVEDTITPTAKDQAFGLVDEYALASRLSYFLWSTMPDDELFDLARRGELRKNQDAQVKRLLNDPRSEAFVQNFAGQWLQIRDIDTIPIDARVVLARDNGTEAQMRADDEAQKAALANFGRGRGAGAGARGNRGQQNQQQQQNPNAPQQTPPQVAGAAPQQTPPPAAAEQTPQAQVPVPAVAQGQAPAAAQPQQPVAAAPAATPEVKPAEIAAALPQPGAAPQAAPAAGAADQQAVAIAAGAPAAGAAGAPVAGAAGARGARGIRGNFGNRGGRGGGPPPIVLDAPLRKAMRQETEMYFGHIVHDDRSVLELIDSNYTYLNAALAKHYNIPDVTGNEMRLVTLPEGSPRGGVLTQGAILAVTSNPTRTSPVKRGLFVLENILGTPPPPPPNDIPPLEDAEKKIDGHEPTVRESLELHRNTPLCQSCHQRMDPLGLAMENFNALGMWREKERNQPVEVSGQLVTGEQLKSVKDLKQVITTVRRSDYYQTLTEKLLTYALGRGTDFQDVETVDQIVKRIETNDGRFSALLMGVIESPAFQKRRTTPAPVASASAEPVSQSTPKEANH